MVATKGYKTPSISSYAVSLTEKMKEFQSNLEVKHNNNISQKMIFL